MSLPVEFNRITDIVQTPEVKACMEFAEKYHLKWLFVHQTRWQTIWGTLSDGHNRLSDAQKYSAGLREARNYAIEIVRTMNNTKAIVADHMDAKEELASAQKESQRLRAESKIANAELALEEAKIHAEGLKYMLDAVLSVVKQLEQKVTSKYETFEASELENNLAIADYQAAKRLDGYDEHMPHLMLDPVSKARVGLATKQNSLLKALEYAEPEAVKQLAGGDVAKLISIIDESIKAINQQPLEQGA